MRFWDSSAIVPLIVEEADTALRRRQLEADGRMLVWYATWAEIESALCRKDREVAGIGDSVEAARTRLVRLAASWTEIEPTQQVRARALRLLRTHALRAADAFQLAAALVVFRERTAAHDFLTGDARLREAARAEGFRVKGD